MINSHTLKTRGVSFIVWFVCTLIASGCMLTFNYQASEQMNKLESLAATIPILIDSTLIKKENHIVRSHVSKCARTQILQLYGTNTMTFQEIVNYYATHLDKDAWRVTRIDENGAGFVDSDGIDLGISLTINWPLSLTENVQGEMAKFETLYLVSLGSFVEPNVSVEQCT